MLGLDSEIYGYAAPRFRGYVGEGFGEVPTMTEEVLRIILALSIHMIRRFGEDDGAIVSSAFAMSMRIFDTNLSGVRMLRMNAAFGDGETTLTGSHLNAMVGDA